MNNKHMLLCTIYFIIVGLHTMFTVYLSHSPACMDSFPTIGSLTQLLTTHSCFLLDSPFVRRLGSQEPWLPSSLLDSCFHEASCHVLTCPLERSSLGQPLIHNPQGNESCQQPSEWRHPSPGELEMTAAPADTLTTACERPWSTELS